jgi:hypothetical protein
VFTTSAQLIVALNDKELAGLDELYRRGTANGVPNLRIVDEREMRHIEPHCQVEDAEDACVRLRLTRETAGCPGNTFTRNRHCLVESRGAFVRRRGRSAWRPHSVELSRVRATGTSHRQQARYGADAATVHERLIALGNGRFLRRDHGSDTDGSYFCATCRDLRGRVL